MSAQTLAPSTEAAQRFSRQHAEVHAKIGELDARRKRLLRRGRPIDREAASTIKAEIDQLARRKRIRGFIDAHGGEWYFDAHAGQRVIDWIERFCVHKKGEWRGKPLKLARWQRKIIRQVFGWKKPNGYRRFNEVWLEVARKNGKSLLAGAIGLYLTFGDRENAAEVYFIAGSRDQAKRLAFADARSMIELRADLSDQIDVAKYGFVHGRSDSFAEVLGGKNQHGLNPHGCIGDEVHEWSGRDQYEAVTTADGARNQALFVFITTAGHDLQSLCGELHRNAIAVRDGHVYQPELYVRIYTLAPDDDWKDPKNWPKANPGLVYGAPKLEAFEKAFRRVQGRPAEENSFKRLRLNMWTSGHSAWMTREVWDDCQSDIDWSQLIGATCFAGLDLAPVNDLCALALWFPPGNPVAPRDWLLASRFWCNRAKVEANSPSLGDGQKKTAASDGVNYQRWADLGLITVTDAHGGAATDFSKIEDDLAQIGQMFDVQTLAYDQHKASVLIANLEGRGFEERCRHVPQTIMYLGPPTAEMERLATAGQMQHGGQEVMDWCVMNTVVEHNTNGDYRPNKAKSSARIDGAVAAVMGMAAAMTVEHKTPLDDFLSSPVMSSAA